MLFPHAFVVVRCCWPLLLLLLLLLLPKDTFGINFDLCCCCEDGGFGGIFVTLFVVGIFGACCGTLLCDTIAGSCNTGVGCCEATGCCDVTFKSLISLPRKTTFG